MAERKQVYKCELCGNVVEVLHGADGDLVCCGTEMVLFEEKTVDEGKEKHVPVIETTTEGVKVKVGSNPHPMEENTILNGLKLLTGRHPAGSI